MTTSQKKPTPLPAGFSIKECAAEEFWKRVQAPLQAIFAGDLSMNVRDTLSDQEMAKLKIIGENFRPPFFIHSLVLKGDELAGWTWGYQDSGESFCMVNSATLPEHRGRGIYAALLGVTLRKLIDKGFQRIWSRHTAVNNAIIIPKLRAGFLITGTELSDTFGSLIHLTYFTSSTRRKILDFRAGLLYPDQELKRIFKLEPSVDTEDRL